VKQALKEVDEYLPAHPAAYHHEAQFPARADS